MKYILIFTALFFVFSSFAQENEEIQEALTGAKIFFPEKSYDFGDIKQGDKVSHVFEFENIGNEPLILTDVRTTCGCTAPEWPREPIAPGSRSEVKVVFNSAGKMGVQTKVITIMTNAVNNPARIKIMTNVMPKDTGF